MPTEAGKDLCFADGTPPEPNLTKAYLSRCTRGPRTLFSSSRTFFAYLALRLGVRSDLHSEDGNIVLGGGNTYPATPSYSVGLAWKELSTILAQLQANPRLA